MSIKNAQLILMAALLAACQSETAPAEQFVFDDRSYSQENGDGGFIFLGQDKVLARAAIEEYFKPTSGDMRDMRIEIRDIIHDGAEVTLANIYNDNDPYIKDTAFFARYHSEGENAGTVKDFGMKFRCYDSENTWQKEIC